MAATSLPIACPLIQVHQTQKATACPAQASWSMTLIICFQPWPWSFNFGPESFSGVNAQGALLRTLKKPIKFLFVSVLWNTKDKEQPRCRDGSDPFFFLEDSPTFPRRTHPAFSPLKLTANQAFLPCFNLPQFFQSPEQIVFTLGFKEYSLGLPQ